MALDFPNSPANNEMYPRIPTFPGVCYVAKTSPSKTWRDIRGRADSYNRFSNPALQVSQVNWDTNGVNSQGLWIADEWHVYYRTPASNPASIVSWRGQLIFDVITPGGSDRRARITIETADPNVAGTNKYLLLEQGIEGTRMIDMQWGTANAKQLVVRFGFKGPAGTYSFTIYNGGSANDRSYVTSWTITPGQANTDTLQTFVIPGCTDGDWPTTTSAWGWFDWSIADYDVTPSPNQWVTTGIFTCVPGQSNGMSTVGNVFEFFDFGLYADPNFTGQPPVFVVPHYNQEFQRMQRYIARVYGIRGIMVATNTISRGGMTLPVAMRVTPAIWIQGSCAFWDGSASAATGGGGSVGASYSNPNYVCVDVTTNGGAFTFGRAATQYQDGYWNAFIADASL